MAAGHQTSPALPAGKFLWAYQVAYPFDKIRDKVVLKAGIIPKFIGIYFLAISDNAGVNRKRDNCTRFINLLK
jgi:hypothetical protein